MQIVQIGITLHILLIIITIIRYHNTHNKTLSISLRISIFFTFKVPKS